jgi:hypothetical protein
VTKILDKKKVKYEITTDLNSVIPHAGLSFFLPCFLFLFLYFLFLDVVYALRVQKERFENVEDYNRVKDAYVFNAKVHFA